MNDKELIQLGVPRGEAIVAARTAIQNAARAGLSKPEIRRQLRLIVRNPSLHEDHAQFGDLAHILASQAAPPSVEALPGEPAPFQQWGVNLDPESVQQMRNACSLPVSVRGALMPDAHVGYGLPIGGVLATRGAVIPYAVGVDIACRMKLSVLEFPPSALNEDTDRLKRAIESETRFGVGAEFKAQRRQHPVMDRNWNVSPVTRELKDKAWAQLGTSGSGNHFVEFGTLEVKDGAVGLPPGEYLALLSHSGSRGTGAQVCEYYSKIARNQHPELPGVLRHLAWLDLENHHN
ncbi:MAG: RtcB family protein, partial [Candidatus Hydrogenedentes bacterium]|nr:RtcB family protein [Candidatus Hydrogenedentota bacterium]